MLAIELPSYSSLSSAPKEPLGIWKLPRKQVSNFEQGRAIGLRSMLSKKMKVVPEEFFGKWWVYSLFQFPEKVLNNLTDFSENRPKDCVKQWRERNYDCFCCLLTLCCFFLSLHLILGPQHHHHHHQPPRRSPSTTMVVSVVSWHRGDRDSGYNLLLFACSCTFLVVITHRMLKQVSPLTWSEYSATAG